MRWFVLFSGVFVLGGLTVAGYATMLWLAQSTEPSLTSAQAELLETARWLTHNGAIMLGAFFFGWLAGQVR